MTNTINAAANPALANDLLNKALNETPAQENMPEIALPSDVTVDLPGGYITATGEVFSTAEVKELNGKDEEAISRASTLGKALLVILQRGTVKVGSEPATEQILDQLLVGDRDQLLLGILKATFGPDVDVISYCQGCNENKTVSINIQSDIKVKILTDPISDRIFTVAGKNKEFTVKLPNGIVQKKMIENMDKTPAELSTVILEGTVIKIGDAPVYSPMQVQALSVTDRRKIIDEINDRAPGPQFTDVTVTCPDCEGEVLVPINLGTLFQF
jgi:hypothetical protein